MQPQNNGGTERRFEPRSGDAATLSLHKQGASGARVLSEAKHRRSLRRQAKVQP